MYSLEMILKNKMFCLNSSGSNILTTIFCKLVQNYEKKKNSLMRNNLYGSFKCVFHRIFFCFWITQNNRSNFCMFISFQRLCCTGYSLSVGLFFASISPKYDSILSIELLVQYKKTTKLVHVVYVYKIFFFDIQDSLMYTTCTKLVIERTIFCHNLG